MTASSGKQPDGNIPPIERGRKDVFVVGEAMDPRQIVAAIGHLDRKPPSGWRARLDERLQT